MSEERLIEAFVRGFSKPLILWLILIKPMHGYDLMQEFKSVTGKRLKSGLVYPFLHSLEAGGYIVGKWIKNDRRHVKSYRLTIKGESLLKSLKTRIGVPLREMLLELLRTRERRKNSQSFI